MYNSYPQPEISAQAAAGGAQPLTTIYTNTKSYPIAQATYHEIVQNPDLFLQMLRSFHSSFGTRFKLPTVGGSILDLHRLFVEVTSRGGIEKVVREKKWKDVAGSFRFPSSITSASFVLRNHYLTLLYHFEQVYFFRKGQPSLSAADSATSPINGSTVQSVHQDYTNGNYRSEAPNLEAGCTVNGTIDAKFDCGYLVTVNIGSEKLNGVLYHSPATMSYKSARYDILPEFSPREQKRSQRELKDPSRPKPNRSGYTFFFAEQYHKLKPLYHGQVKSISKKIGVLWNQLSESERQVFQEKASRDKERYKIEMLEYNALHSPNSLLIHM